MYATIKIHKQKEFKLEEFGVTLTEFQNVRNIPL